MLLSSYINRSKMTKLKYYCFFVFLFSSCIDIHDKFTYYKDKPFIDNKSRNLRISGVYCSYNHTAHCSIDIIYFYSDGSVYLPNYAIDSLSFVQNPSKGIAQLQQEYERSKEWFFEKKRNSNSNWPVTNNWGAYIVRGDSLYIQFFTYNYQYWMRRNTIEYQGTIQNDSTFLIIREICPWWHKLHPEFNDSGIRVMNPPEKYGFYKVSFKPDSSLAWYKNQEWYKKWIENK